MLASTILASSGASRHGKYLEVDVRHSALDRIRITFIRSSFGFPDLANMHAPGASLEIVEIMPEGRALRVRPPERPRKRWLDVAEHERQWISRRGC